MATVTEARLSEAGGGYSGVVVIVPTRNRADIAMNAVSSVLDQSLDNVEILVSDNSTIGGEAQRLASYCSSLNDPRVRYAAPPAPLSMAPHWEWAIQLALSKYGASHFIYLTDRFMFKTGALKRLSDVIVRHPDKVVSYTHDQIADHINPILVYRQPHSGRLLELRCDHLVYLAATHPEAIRHDALPRMLNCVVPRSVLYNVYSRFGSIFSSIAPDYNFCFRSLSLEESILYLDCPITFDYALDRSHGTSVLNGKMTAANADFVACLAADNLKKNYATPIPGLDTSINSMFHEYLVVKEEVGGPRFVDLDMDNYLETNAREVENVADPRLRNQMTNLLLENGYQGQIGSSHIVERVGPSARGLFEKTVSKIDAVIRSRMAVLFMRPISTRFWIYIARKFKFSLPAENRLVFSRVEDAIEYVRHLSRDNLDRSSARNALLRGKELSS